MSQLYTAAEIMAITGGRLLQGSPQTPVSGFTYDSRLVLPGDCFVALPGERTDGHAYTAAAVHAGAVCVLAGRPVEAEGATVIAVADPLLALGQLGRDRRQRFFVPLVGITGSVGKTTTKELVTIVLAERFTVFRSAGNFNSEVGLPITLMGLDQTHEAAVLEMGMRALGEIDYLVSIALPTVGLITNVGLSHLELLGSQENIARAKSELVRGLPPDGTAVLNADDPKVAAMAKVSPNRVWFYGFGAEGKGERWVTVRSVERDGEMGQRIRLAAPVGEVEAVLPAPGRHMVLNAMAATAVGLEFGMSLSQVASGLARYVPSGNRLRVIRVAGVCIVDDSYNAAPSSVMAALGVMRELAGPDGRCAAVLGDMYELGAAQEEGHRQVGIEAARLADQVIAVGALGRIIAQAAGPHATHCDTRSEAVAAVRNWVRPGDTILVKGSRGMAMEEIVAALEKELTV